MSCPPSKCWYWNRHRPPKARCTTLIGAYFRKSSKLSDCSLRWDWTRVESEQKLHHGWKAIHKHQKPNSQTSKVLEAQKIHSEHVVVQHTFVLFIYLFIYWYINIYIYIHMMYVCVCACGSNTFPHLKEKVLKLHHPLQQGAASAALGWRDGCGRESSSSNLWQYCPGRGATVDLFRLGFLSALSQTAAYHTSNGTQGARLIHEQIYGYILSRYVPTV